MKNLIDRYFRAGGAIGFYTGFMFIMLCRPGLWFMTTYSFGQALFVLLHAWIGFALLCALLSRFFIKPMVRRIPSPTQQEGT